VVKERASARTPRASLGERHPANAPHRWTPHRRAPLGWRTAATLV